MMPLGKIFVGKAVRCSADDDIQGPSGAHDIEQCYSFRQVLTSVNWHAICITVLSLHLSASV